MDKRDRDREERIEEILSRLKDYPMDKENKFNPSVNYYPTLKEFSELDFYIQKEILKDAIIKSLRVMRSLAIFVHEAKINRLIMHHDYPDIIYAAIASMMCDDNTFVITDSYEYEMLKNFIKEDVRDEIMFYVSEWSKFTGMEKEDILRKVAFVDFPCQFIFLFRYKMMEDNSEIDEIMKIVKRLRPEKNVVLIAVDHDNLNEPRIIRDVLDVKFSELPARFRTILDLFHICYYIKNKGKRLTSVSTDYVDFLYDSCHYLLSVIDEYKKEIEHMKEEKFYFEKDCQLKYLKESSREDKLRMEIENLKKRIDELKVEIRVKDELIADYRNDRISIESKRDSDKDIGYYKNLPKSEARKEKSHNRFMDYYYDSMVYKDESMMEDIKEFIKNHVNMY